MCNHENFQLMSLGTKHKNNQMKTDVMNNIETVESHSEMKLLRVTFDEHLNFSRHIGEVCKNASRKVGVLMRLRNMKVKNDHRSEFSNLSNWKEEA